MVKEEDETENSYRNSEKIRNAQGFFFQRKSNALNL